MLYCETYEDRDVFCSPRSLSKSGALKFAKSTGRSRAADKRDDREQYVSVTYYVALPFVRMKREWRRARRRRCPKKGLRSGEPKLMSRYAANAGALAFKRSGDPNIVIFADASIFESLG